MIPRTLPTWQAKSWQDELHQLITDPTELISLLKLDEKWLEPAKTAAQHFPLRVTRSFLGRMQQGDPKDPLLMQVLPLIAELESIEGYTTDPLAEEKANVAPGLVHKYHGRVLFITAPQCAINCRYCFRRHFDYTSNSPSRNQWQQALDYLSKDTSIEEVILSGGDPLVLSDKQLGWLIEQFEGIKHLQRLRIHSRLPIVAPQRITNALSSLIGNSRLLSTLVIHCNHSQEIDTEVATNLQKLRKEGVTLLNQSVLMKGINDCQKILTNLSKGLFEVGVLPYYLHMPDKVKGTSHFNVNDNRAIQIYRELLSKLPGYLVPKLVRESPEFAHKVPLDLDIF